MVVSELLKIFQSFNVDFENILTILDKKCENLWLFTRAKKQLSLKSDRLLGRGAVWSHGQFHTGRFQ